MSKGVEINFHGMGGLLSSAGCVLMPNRPLNAGMPAMPGMPGHNHAGGDVAAHRTRLVVPTRPDVLGDSQSWLPDEVLVYDEMELGIWILDGLDVTIETSEPASPVRKSLKSEPPNAGNDMVPRWDVISLRELHPEAVTRPDWRNVPGCARIFLTGGVMRGGGRARFERAGSYTGKDVSSYLSWKSNRVEAFAITNGNRRIVLSMGSGSEALKLSITNGAAVAGDHFPIMYTLINSAKQPLIDPRESTGAWTYPAETCKPPIELPEP